MKFTNSPLVTYKNLTKNKTTNRNHAIDTIIIHCFVGQVTAQQGCDYFATTTRQCSANYVIGRDGSIGLSVEEKDRAWCSGGKDKNGNVIKVNGISGAMIDHRAIAIEVASGTKEPYVVTDAAYKALIALCADICKRNNIKKLLWEGKKNLVGDITKQNMTVHRWFANKSCPGTYLYDRHNDIAEQVNKILDADAPKPKPKPETKPSAPFKSYLVKINTAALNIRKGAGTNYAKVGCITDRGIYTIVAESAGQGSDKGWGKLKSGTGWISLDYCIKR